METLSVLEHYRRDQSREVSRVLGLGALFVAAGALVVGYGLHLRHGHLAGAEAVIAVGVLVVGLGPISTIVRMQRLLCDEQYLAVLRQGLLYQENEAITHIAWDEVVAIRRDPACDRVVIERRAGVPVVVAFAFAGTSATELARHLEHLRIKAGMNLLGRPS